MNTEERQLITGFFERMRNHGAPEKDREAEALINQLIRTNPDAPYMLVQTVLVQEQTLEAANNRVLELEEQLRRMEEGDRSRSSRSGGFLDSFWGGRRARSLDPASPRSARGRRLRPMTAVAMVARPGRRAPLRRNRPSSRPRRQRPRVAASCARPLPPRRVLPAECWWLTASAT